MLAAIGAALGILAAPLVEARTQRPPESRPALWKVSDADTTIYLFGTIHALPANIPWYRGQVAAAFEGSKELVTEIADADPAAMQRTLLAKAVLPEGQSLRDLLSPEEKARFEAALAAQNLPVAAFDRFEPWYAAMALATLPLLKDGFAAEMGVENLLGTRAKALGRPQSALETVEYQLGLFDRLSLDVQKRYLLEVIKTLPTMKGDLAKIIEAWKAGDAETLAALVNAEEDDPALVAALITDRNKAWAEWIKTRLDTPGTVFVAVGAGHLAGTGSVQDQLAAKGIRTTRLQ